jgi:hypothetical protein
MAHPKAEGENRTAARFKAALPATLHLPDRDHDCSADDLSRTGVRLTGRFPAVANPHVQVSIRTVTGDVVVRLDAQMVFVRSGRPGEESTAGLMFEQLTEGQTAALGDLVDRVVEGMAPAALASLTRKSPPQEIRAALAKIPLAHRVMLAGRAFPVEREWLRHDEEPAVLEALVRNPHVTLPEIKVLLRRPDLLASTLDWIASDPRWLGDDEVKIMVCTHARVTFATADRVVARMSDLVIARLIVRPALQPGVKQKLMHKLSLKHRGGS